MVLRHFEPLSRGQPVYKGHNSWIYMARNASFLWSFTVY